MEYVTIIRYTMLVSHAVILAIVTLSSSADDSCPPFPEVLPSYTTVDGCLCGTGQTRCEELDVCDPKGNNGQGECTPACPSSPALDECQCADVRCKKGERCDTDDYIRGFCRAQCPGGNQTASERCYCGIDEFCDAGSVCFPGEDVSECVEQCIPHRQAKWECQCASLRCGEGEICDPKGNDGKGQCATRPCPQGKLAKFDCQCGTQLCLTRVTICNNGQCDLPLNLQACSASPAMAPAAGCICGARHCTEGESCSKGECKPPGYCVVKGPAREACICGTAVCQVGETCDRAEKQCLPTCPKAALATERCSCFESASSSVATCETGQLCSLRAAFGSKCLQDRASNCEQVTGLCNNPAYPKILKDCEASCAAQGF